jgi:hypothetical protein
MLPKVEAQRGKARWHLKAEMQALQQATMGSRTGGTHVL